MIRDPATVSDGAQSGPGTQARRIRRRPSARDHSRCRLSIDEYPRLGFQSDCGAGPLPVADFIEQHRQRCRGSKHQSSKRVHDGEPILKTGRFRCILPNSITRPTGSANELPELLAEARRRPLNETKAWALAEALRKHEPWLEWAGKREAKSFAVDPVDRYPQPRTGFTTGTEEVECSRRILPETS